MADRVNWIEQIRKRNDEELWQWMEEVSNPRVLALAMTELSLRAIKRLEKSMDAFAVASDRHSQRMAFVTKSLVGLTVALILVTLVSAVFEARRLFGGDSRSVLVTEAARAQAPQVPSESQCALQAGKAMQQFTHQQLEKQLNFRVLASENHYNRELQKCFVEMRTFGGDGENMGMSTYVLDAYENSTQLYCFTPVRPRPNAKPGPCVDRKANSVQREEADKQIMQLMER